MKTLIVDITNRCNLRCTHCYYYRDNYPRQELTDAEWKLIFSYNKPDIAVFIGGEPLLRKKLLRDLTPIVPVTFTVTNGIFPLVGLNTQYIVSIDGTREYHEKIRGKGTYNKVKRNIDFDCIIAMTITEQNKKCIEDFYNEWKDKVKGVRFNFYSPLSDKDPMKVTSKDYIIEQLKAMDILNPHRELDYWKEENMEETRKNCPEKTGDVIRLDCMGKQKQCNNKLCSATYCALNQIMVKA